MFLNLAVIVKDEIVQVSRIVKDYEQYFDGLHFAVDDQSVFFSLKETYKNNPKINFYKFEWCNDFSKKRNWLQEQISKDSYIFRMDTDDEIDHPELIRKAFDNYARDGYTVIFFNYQYGFDESGNCNAQHWRETIIKNDGNIFWNKKIHENINPKILRKMKAAKETKISIIHKSTPEQRLKSAERNLAYLMEEYEATKDKPDARTVGYIARMYLGMKKYREAIPFFENFLHNSGWDDDKFFAWVQLSDCYGALGRWEEALSCCVEAMLMKPEFPDAYFHMMGVYFEKKEYAKAIHWGKIGFTKKSPDTMIVTDLASYTWRPMAQMAMCCMQTGQFKEAIGLLQKAKDIAPKEESINNALKQFTEVYMDNEAVKDYMRLMQYTRSDLRKFRALIDSIPNKIKSDERLLSLKNFVEPGKIWDKNTVVIFCGQAWEDWVDSSVVGGIGGSEEAVVYMSRELTKLGYKVTVFNQCGELAGNYNGVEYKSFYEFNPKDQFDIVISWRNNIFDGKVRARRRIVWLHDVPSPDTFVPEEMDKLDKVVVLSEYHKSLLKGVPEEKIFVSSNGLNIKDFENINEERNPHRMIYASSYDRGLEKLLVMFPKIKEEVPDAELHIFYGWNTYDEMVKTGRRSAEWKNRMLILMDQPGVFEHGRIGQKKLVKEHFKSGVWAYPTLFTEISCIGAMRSQACGAIPVVNDYAALKETVKWGIKNEGDVTKDETFVNYATKLIALLKDNETQEKIRQEMMPKAIEQFGWNKIAESWKAQIL